MQQLIAMSQEEKQVDQGGTYSPGSGTSRRRFELTEQDWSIISPLLP